MSKNEPQFHLDPIFVDRIETLALALERSHTYRQAAYANNTGHACATPACIAGHAVFLSLGGDIERFVAFQSGNKHFVPWDATAERWMGIEYATTADGYDVAEMMFAGDPMPDAGDPTGKHAAAMLRHFLKTGEVDWEGTQPEEDR